MILFVGALMMCSSIYILPLCMLTSLTICFLCFPPPPYLSHSVSDFLFNFPFTLERGRAAQCGTVHNSSMLRNRSKSRERMRDTSLDRAYLANGAPIPKEGEQLLERLSVSDILWIGYHGNIIDMLCKVIEI